MKYFVLFALLAAASAQSTEDPIHLPGGLHKIEVTDSRLVDILAQAQKDLNARQNSLQLYKVGKVLEAATQVVAGVMYHVTFEFGATKCLKSEATTKEAMAACEGFDQVQVCKVRVHSVPWTHTVETSSFHCEAKVVAPVTGQFYANELPGGHHKMDVNDAELLKTLTEVTPQVNDKLESTFFHRIGKVLSAESQVVSGVIYHVSFELGETQCLKSKVTKDTNVLTECSAFTHVQVCNAKIWSQPWLNHLEVTEVKCEARKPDVMPPTDIRGPVITNP